MVHDVSLTLPELLDSLAKALELRNFMFRCPPNILLKLGKLIGKGNMMMKLVDSLEVDDTKIRGDLGWEPPVGFTDAIDETISWFRSEVED